jgi:hypothetical protein
MKIKLIAWSACAITRHVDNSIIINTIVLYDW